MTFCDAIKADTYRRHGRFHWGLTLAGVIAHPGFRALCTMRACQAVSATRAPWRWALPLFKLLHHLTCHAAAIDLSWRTAIGAGLAITHGWGLVITPGAQIGRNVTLFHGVTIGRRDSIGADGTRRTVFPIIQDEVWVGPHAIIVGGITIGRGSRIAGGALVTTDIPSHCVVVGNPATIVKHGCMPDVMHAAPIRPVGERA